jgi:hypothetical protein
MYMQMSDAAVTPAEDLEPVIVGIRQVEGQFTHALITAGHYARSHYALDRAYELFLRAARGLSDIEAGRQMNTKPIMVTVPAHSAHRLGLPDKDIEMKASEAFGLLKQSFRTDIPRATRRAIAARVGISRRERAPT